MSAAAQLIQLIGFILAVIVPCLTLIVTILISRPRPTDARAHADIRFDAHDPRLHPHYQALAARLQLFEERIDARLARTERLLRLR
jgi:hypothetical protein